MLPSRKRLVSIVITFVVVVFASVRAELICAQDPTPLPLEVYRQPAGTPERVDLETGKYKMVYRDKDGKVIHEETHLVTGSLVQIKRIVQKTFIHAVYPDGKPAKVEGVEFDEDSPLQVIKRETIEYDAKGQPIRTQIEKVGKDGRVTERTIYPGSSSENVRLITTWPYGRAPFSRASRGFEYGSLGVTRFQSSRDGKWDDLPGQPHVPQAKSTSQEKTSQAPSTTTGEAFVRGRANGQESFLFSFSGGPIDSIQVKLPTDTKLSLGFASGDWSFTQDGKDVQFSGPARDSLHLRLDSADPLKKSAGKKIQCKAMLKGKTLNSFEMVVNERPNVTVSNTLDEKLTLPPEIPVGSPFLVTPAKEFSAGEWRLGLRPLIPINMGTYKSLMYLPEQTDTATTPRNLSYTLPEPLPIEETLAGMATTPRNLSYTDEYGDEGVSDDGRKYFIFNPRKRGESSFSPPKIERGDPFAFQSQSTCVNGSFPDPIYWFSISIDGKQPLIPIAASTKTLILAIPKDTAPGQYNLQWFCTNCSAGGNLGLGILGLEGSIDQNKLWTGQSTTMRLKILGTDQSLPLKITNQTPTVINVAGGVVQMVNTSGGSDNSVERSVQGIHRGNFQIDYSLNYDQCRGTGKP